MEFNRLPRFKRSSAIPQIKLTERDRHILKHVHDHRFLRSDHLTALLSGSRQQVLRRLQRLYHHSFLDRPRCQIHYYESGSDPMVYGIGNKGAAILKRELSLPFHRLTWPQKPEVNRLFLQHALLTSDVMVALELACRNTPGVQLVSSRNIQIPNNGASKREPFHWTVDIASRVKCGVIPDGVFGLRITTKGGTEDFAWFFLEADRGTMPVMRAGLSQSSFYRKLLAYEATWAQNIHRTRFGWNRFRVLTVTNNVERMNHLIEACQGLKHGRGLFLFTNLESLRTCNDFFSLRWHTARADAPTSLLH